MNLNSKKWTEFLFEGRNKEYGAYILRSNSSRRHFFAFLIVFLLAMVTISVPFLIDYIKSLTGSSISLDNAMPPIPSIRMEESFDLRDYARDMTQPDPSASDDRSPESMQLEDENNFTMSESSTIQLDDILNKVKESQHKAVSKGADEMLEKLEPDHIYLIVDVMPLFPGGNSALLKYITANLDYPQDAQRRKAQGRVLCEFIVNEDGTISNLRVVENVDPLLDREALRILRLMPRWSPGLRLGKPVKVKFTIPINFQI